MVTPEGTSVETLAELAGARHAALHKADVVWRDIEAYSLLELNATRWSS